jgi:hypothetical protein
MHSSLIPTQSIPSQVLAVGGNTLLAPPVALNTSPSRPAVRLNTTQLRLAIADYMRNTNPAERTLQGAVQCLWKEDPEEISRLYDAAVFGLYDVAFNDPGHHGMRAERMRELRSPLPMRQRTGSTIHEIAASAGIGRATLVALLKHHGYADLFPYGREQSRFLLTEASFKAGIGHNVQPGASVA